MGSSLSGSKKAADVVVEDGSRRIRRAEIRERAARHAARTKDPLQVGFRPGALEPEAVAVLKTAARSTALGGNDDGSVCRIDSVEGGSLGPLQHSEARDVLRIEVGSSIGEVDASITERSRRTQIRGEHAGIEGAVVHRQAVEDHQRLIVTADGADASDGDHRRSAGHARSARHIDTGDATLQRIHEIVTLRLSDLRAGDALLGRPEGPLLGGLS